MTQLEETPHPGGVAGRPLSEPRREAKGRGERGPKSPEASRADGANDPRMDVPRPRRRWVSAERKFQIFLECSIPGIAVGEILRREGLYSTDLARIREQVKEGALQRLKQGPGRKRKSLPPEQVERLVKDLQQKEEALVALSVEYMALKKNEARVSKGR